MTGCGKLRWFSLASTAHCSRLERYDTASMAVEQTCNAVYLEGQSRFAYVAKVWGQWTFSKSVYQGSDSTKSFGVTKDGQRF